MQAQYNGQFLILANVELKVIQNYILNSKFL